MKIAIDSYCYHRQFGDWYADLQRDPGTRITVWDFLDRANALGVEGVSLESCYLPEPTDRFLGELADRLAERALEPVWAWGHPNGLHSGHSPEAEDDLVRHLAFARRIGARVMRICAGGRRTRPADWESHRAALLPVLRRIADAASRAGIVLAVENHIDLLADELAELIETVDSPALGVCLDTGNNLRLFEDPLAVARRLAPYARATHVKNMTARPGNPRDFAFWPSVPLDADGLVDLPAILALLRGAGYAGLLAIEIDFLHPAYGDDEDAAVARSVAWLRRAVGETTGT
jgi:3-oxoisoapionate decarboxylase